MAANNKFGGWRPLTVATTTLTIIFLATSTHSLPTRRFQPGDRAEVEEQQQQQNIGSPTLTGPAVTSKPGKKGKGERRPYWWENPCGVRGFNRTLPHDPSELPHELDTDNKLYDKWLVNLKVAKDDLEEKMKDLIDLTGLVPEHLATARFTHDWLPTLDKFSEKPTLPLRRLVKEIYRGLQLYAVTLECLLQGNDCRRLREKKGKRKHTKQPRELIGVKGALEEPQENHRKKHHAKRSENDEAKRATIIKAIVEKLKTLLCEVQSLIHNLKTPIPTAPSPKIINEHNWTTQPDLSHQLVQDYGILNNYTQYLRQVENVGNSGSCDSPGTVPSIDSLMAGLSFVTVLMEIIPRNSQSF